MVCGPDFRAARTAASRGSRLVWRRLPRERQIEQRRISGSIGRSRGILVACGREGGRATQPASCDSRRAGRHRYPQARGDRAVSFASSAGFGPGRGAAADFARTARSDRPDGDRIVSRPESARAGIGKGATQRRRPSRYDGWNSSLHRSAVTFIARRRTCGRRQSMISEFSGRSKPTLRSGRSAMAFVSMSRPSGATIRCLADVAAVLYRFVQEGLTNVLKHAQRQQGQHCAREEIGRAGAGS